MENRFTSSLQRPLSEHDYLTKLFQHLSTRCYQAYSFSVENNIYNRCAHSCCFQDSLDRSSVGVILLTEAIIPNIAVKISMWWITKFKNSPRKKH